MRKNGIRTAAFALAAAGLLQAGLVSAQGGVKLPEASQEASVRQRVGLTDIEIEYHRPLVKGRTVFGSLEPWDKVWRAGANENTTISFSTDVTVEGQPLPAGTYGLHMIPNQNEWTVIFSKDSTSWGSYFYDQAQDALRVKVKPAQAPHHEALTFDFDDPAEDSVTVALKWDKVAVPFKVGVDLKKTVLASIQREMKSLPAFTWEGLQSAAEWSAENGVNLEQALRWVDQSVQAEERFENLRTRSLVLEKMGKTAESQQAMARALEVGNAQQIHFYGRQLLQEGKNQEALAILKKNAEKHPDAWFTGTGLARAYAANGDFKSAVASMKEALAKAPENQKAQVQALLTRLEKGEKI